MIRAEVAITIRRPRADVAAVLFNPGYDVSRRARAGEAGPWPSRLLRQGDKARRSFRLAGYRLGALCDVVAYAPNRWLEMVGPPPLGLRIRYELEGIPEGTIVHVRVQSVPPRGLGWFLPLLNRLLRRAVRQDLSRLKALLESGTQCGLAA